MIKLKTTYRLKPDEKVKKCIRKIMIVLRPDKDMNGISLCMDCRNENYEIEVYSPYFIDGDKIIKKIENKISSNQELLLEDYEALENLIFTKHTMENHQILLKGAELLHKMDCNEKIKRNISLAFQQQGVRYVNKKYMEKTLEELLMCTRGFIEEYDYNLKKEAKEEGKEEGREEMEKFKNNLKKEGISQEIINRAMKGI